MSRKFRIPGLALALTASVLAGMLGGCNSLESESRNADLEELSLSDVVLEPGFSPAVIGYSATVDSSVDSTSVSATSASGKARVSINGSDPQRGSASATVALSVGANTISILVRAESGRQKTYTVEVTRPAPTYAIGGSVSGLEGTLTLQNNGGDDLVLSANGAFVFATPLDDGAAYGVTVSSQPENQECTASAATGTVSGADVTSVSIQCSSIGTFWVGGTVNGLVGTGVLQLNGAANLLIASNGPFLYSSLLADGADYEVTVLTQPAGQTCTVADGSGTIEASNALDVSVDCTGLGTVSGSMFDWQWVTPRPQGNQVADFASNGSLVVAVGQAGLVMTSTDGLDWVVRDAGTGEYLSNVIWGDGEFIAVGSRGAVTVSQDGVTWRAQSLGNIELAGIEWDGSRYVTVGNESLKWRAVAATSTDGEAWLVQTLAELDPQNPNPVADLAWNGSQFLAPAILAGLVYTSPDGTAWTPAQVPIEIQALTSDGTRFVGIAQDATVYTSPDGAAWTAQANPFPATFISGLTWDGSRFLATSGSQFITSPDASTWTVNVVSSSSRVSLGAVTRFAGRNIVVNLDAAIYTSPDDSSWSPTFAAEATRLWDVTWDGSQFVGVGTGPAIRTSPDGVDWTTRLATDPVESIMLSVTYADGQYVAVGNGRDSQSQVLTSPDAINWTSQSIAIDNLSLVDVAWGGGAYVAVNRDGTLLASPDGVAWTEAVRLLDNTSIFRELSGIEWNGSLWVVTGLEFINNSIAGYLWTSPDALTWTRQVMPNWATIEELAWNGSRFVGVGSVLATSVDGLSWTYLSSQLGLRDITWNGSRFIAIGSGPEILESTDGLTWTVSRSKSGSNLAVASGGGATVVVSSGNVGRILVRSEP